MKVLHLMVPLIKGVVCRACWINAEVWQLDLASIFSKILKFTNKASFVDAFSLLSRKPNKGSFQFRVTFASAFRGFWLRTILFWGELVWNSPAKLLTCPCDVALPWTAVGGNYLTWGMPYSTLKHKLSTVTCCETSLAAVISKISAKYDEDQVNSNSDF